MTTITPITQLIEPLTTAEQRVLELMADGLADKEIADELNIAPITVRSDYKQHIYDKLGLEKPYRSKKWALYCARELGLLDGEPTPDNETLSDLFSRPKHNLLVQLIPFVGRESEIAELQKLLTEHRLITILAPGGMGKTRLALEVAHSQIDTFKDGVYFVPLQSLSDVDSIPSQIASSTGFQLADDSRDTRQQVLDFLGNKQILLIMDNFEHLLDGAPLVHDILINAPDVKIITTSREKLNLIGESVYTLKGMEFPTWETPEDALRYDAVKLLVQSAHRVKPDWTVTQENLDYVARVCRLTQGMPLAILLAMSWLDMLSLEEIADEIQVNVDFLAGEMRNMPDRQQSIRAIFETTWKRLTADEQSVFMKMSVFRGGFTIKAVKTITGASLRTLQGLSNKALIQKVDDDRYDLHELLRQYAEQHLNQSGEAENVRDQHMRYYAEAVADQRKLLFTQHVNDAVNDIVIDFENVQSSWLRAYHQQAWDLLTGMVAPLSEVYGLGIKHEEIKELELAVFQDLMNQTMNEEQEILYMNLSWYCPNDFDIATRREIWRQGFEIAQKHHDKAIAAYLLGWIGIEESNQGRIEKAIELLYEALNLAKQSGDAQSVSRVLIDLSVFYMGNGDPQQSINVLEENVKKLNQLGVDQTLSLTYHNMAVAYAYLNDWQKAKQYNGKALHIARKTHALFDVINVNAYAFHQDILFMRLDDATQRHIEQQQLAREINTIWFSLGIHQGTAMLLFAQNQLSENILTLHTPFYEFVLKGEQRGSIQNISHWRMLYLGLLGHFKECMQLMPSIFEHLGRSKRASMFIVGLMAFLPMLQDQGDDIRTVELIAIMNEHPKTLPISNQHPYVLELQAQLQKRLDQTIYQQAWQRGAQLDPMQIAPSLMQEFTEIYS